MNAWRVALPRQDAFLKVLARPEQAQACAREARWGLWAARRGFGPKILATKHDALLTEYLPGRALNAGDMVDATIMRKVLPKLCALHSTPMAPDLPGHRIASALPGALMSIDKAVAQGKLRADEAASLRRLARAAADKLTHIGFPDSVVHGDFQERNIFLSLAGEVTFIDWSDAGRGDAMRDLSHLCMDAFVPVAHLHQIIAWYNGGDTPQNETLHERLLLCLLIDQIERYGAWLQWTHIDCHQINAARCKQIVRDCQAQVALPVA